MGIAQQHKHGFTIVELLIVIVVIGILAAITIVAFNGVQNRANVTAIKSDLNSMKKKLEVFRAESPSNSYPASATELDSLDFKMTKGSYAAVADNNIYYCYNRAAEEVAFGVRAKSTPGYILTTGDGVIERANVWGSDTCGEIGTTWGGVNPVAIGYDGASRTWASWTE